MTSRQTTQTRRWFQEPTSRAPCSSLTSHATPSSPAHPIDLIASVSITRHRPRHFFLRHGQEAAKAIADDDGLASLAAETTLSPLWTEAARGAVGGEWTSGFSPVRLEVAVEDR